MKGIVIALLFCFAIGTASAQQFGMSRYRRRVNPVIVDPYYPMYQQRPFVQIRFVTQPPGIIRRTPIIYPRQRMLIRRRLPVPVCWY